MVEALMGRQRGERWGPRVIDLDIVLYEDLVMDEPNLTVPHMEMFNRRFVLAPLAEIAPDAVHPILGMTAKAMLEQLDNLQEE